MCFKGNCDVTIKAVRLSTARLSKEGSGGWGKWEAGGWIGCWCGGGRLEGYVAMETNRGVSEAVAVGGDDSTLAACK